MADEQTGVIIVDAQGNEHHFPAGFDPTKAAGIVRESTNTVKPVGATEPDTYLEGALKGGMEGAIGGAKGFTKGIVPGAAHGVVNSLMAIPALAKGLLGTAIGTKNLITDPENTLREAAASIKGMPGKAADAINSALALAAKDPEAFGKAVGDVTGQTMVGIAGARALPLAPKPIARAAGSLMEQVGTKGAWPIRMMGAHQLGSGDPFGLLTMAMPGGLKSGGQALQKFGGADTAKGLPSGARAINVGEVKNPGIRLAAENPGVKPSAGRVPLTGSPAEASGRVRKVIAKESKGATKAGTSASIDDQLRAQGLDPNKMISSGPVKSSVDKIAPQTMPDARTTIKAPTLTAPSPEVDLTPALDAVATTPAPVRRPPVATNRAGQSYRSETGGHQLTPMEAQFAEAPVSAPPTVASTLANGADEIDLSNAVNRIAEPPRFKVSNAAGQPLRSETGGPVTPTPSSAPTWTAPSLDEEVDLTPLLGPSSPIRRAQVTSAAGQPLVPEISGPLSPMEAQMASSPKMPLEGNIPASRSRGQMSATPGLTMEDMNTLGINPEMKVTGLPPESIERLLVERAKRAATYRTNAGMDAGAKRALELDEVGSSY